MYDIIGDIHGQAKELVRLLEKLGYTKKEGIYRHPKRKAIFLGDFIDRGKSNLSVIDIVRPMIESSAALSVMGNHEYNAICFHTRDPQSKDKWLRPRSTKNILQHVDMLIEYKGNRSSRIESDINWFRTLPLWIELDGIRIVHACWDDELIKTIGDPYALKNDNFLLDSTKKNSPAHIAIETILKGKELNLPPGLTFTDKDNNQRSEIRVKWWISSGKSYKDVSVGINGLAGLAMDEKIPEGLQLGYDKNLPPVFIGHYWKSGEPNYLTPNVACVDYSVAKPGGKLVAYRWDGERKLSTEKFVSVQRL